MNKFLTEKEFETFRDVIYNESGIHFSETNRTILESRLRDLIRKNDIDTPGEYLIEIKRNGEELKLLLDSVTTNLTRFFRNTAHFNTFEYHVLPDLAKHKVEKGERTLKIWSAGCSTGEEPYSLAIYCKEILPSTINVEIIASDLSLKSLMTSKEGFYPESRMNNVPDKYLKKYFEKKAGGFQVADEIKSMIKFDYHNLKFDPGLLNLDVVFCRNVIIYFDEAAQEQHRSRRHG